MDKYKKLMCVKGLIMSLDEQLYKAELIMADKIIVSYWDAIKEMLSETEKAKEDIKSKVESIAKPIFDYIIKVNDVSHACFEEKITWEQVLLLADLAKTGKEIFKITYDDGKNSGILDVMESIKITNGMIFKVSKVF